MEQETPPFAKNKEDERPSIQTQHLTELVCPVCYEYMQPPIMMCERGHSICAFCHELMSDCPQCQGRLTYRRSSALEALTAVIMFPCKHCNKRYRLEDLETHNCFQGQENDHSPIATCIVGQVYGDCFWSGPSLDMSMHCSKQHSQHYWTLPENSAEWKYSDLSSVGVQNVFIVDLGSAMFVLVQKFHSQLRTLIWNLSCECANNERYDYEIQVFSEDECVLTQKSQIENAFNILTFFPSSNEIVIGLDTISKFLNKDNIIKYKVIIRIRDEVAPNSLHLSNTNNIQTRKHSDEIIEKPHCMNKAWSSMVIFYNTVKKFLHL